MSDVVLYVIVVLFGLLVISEIRGRKRYRRAADEAWYWHDAYLRMSETAAAWKDAYHELRDEHRKKDEPLLLFGNVPDGYEKVLVDGYWQVQPIEKPNGKSGTQKKSSSKSNGKVASADHMDLRMEDGKDDIFVILSAIEDVTGNRVLKNRFDFVRGWIDKAPKMRLDTLIKKIEEQESQGNKVYA